MSAVRSRIFAVSATTRDGLTRRVQHLRDLLAIETEQPLNGLMCGLGCFSPHHAFRRAFVTSSIPGLSRQLAADSPAPVAALTFILSTDFRDDSDTRVLRFRKQLEAFRRLELFGVRPTKIIGSGSSRHAIAAMRREISVETAEKAVAAHADDSPPENLAARLRESFLRDQAASGCAYVTIGPTGTLADAMADVLSVEGARLLSDVDELAVIACAYESGHSLAWDHIHARFCLPSTGPSAFPLSHGQQRLWAIERTSDAAGLYNMSARLSVEGPLDLDVLRRALLTIVHRHDILRTSFHVVDGEPVQAVAPPDSIDDSFFRIVSTESSSDGDDGGDLSAEATRAFDLSRAPLLRVVARQSGSRTHDLLISMHHMISDEWSLVLIARELERAYVDASAGLAPAVDVQTGHGPFAIRQRFDLASGASDDAAAFWTRTLAGGATPLDLQTDRPRPFNRSHAGAAVTMSLGRGRLAALSALCAAHSSSTFAGIVAVADVLLHRYSGQTGYCIGTPVAGRDHRSLDSQIGFFVNTMPLTSVVRTGDTFATLLERTRDSLADALAHQSYPFDLIVNCAAAASAPGRHPLFDVFVELRDDDLSLALPKCTVTRKDLEAKTSKFDLGFEFIRHAGDDLLRLTYSTELFDRSTIERIADHCVRLLDHLIAAPDRDVSGVDFLGADEGSAILRYSRSSREGSSSMATLVDLFERQVDRAPDAVAVCGSDQTMSYAELDEAANSIADALRRVGVSVDDPVALLIDRSAMSIATMLGVLKAGAAYLPLDTSDPDDRLLSVIERAGCRVAVADDRNDARFGSRVSLINVRAAMARPAASRPRIEIPIDSLAYVIFTSGSTGRPNGVMMSHRAVTRLVDGLDPWFATDRGPLRVAVLASFSFDASVQQIFPALLGGHALHVISDDLKRSPADLLAYFSDRHVDISDCTPSWLSLLADVPEDRRLTLQRLIVGGEALTFERVRATLGRGVTGLRISNAYGPTETCVDATIADVDSAADSSPATVSIGSPLPGSTIYVLDAGFGPAPIGVPGEMWIGGDKLARGYIGNPRLTAERFVPSPFGHGERLYRTGDRVKWTTTGALEFLGRIDHQVKIRGHRVEPGEVESAIERASGVDAVVVARGSADHLELVAYVRAVDVPDIAALRARVSDALPAHMVPARFVRVDEFPRNSSGKIDRRALPDVADGPFESGRRFAPARTPVEIALVAAWQDVLRRSPIGVTDNFFELGGDSIRAIQITSRLSRAGYRADLRGVFAHPTIEGWAPHVSQIDAAGSRPRAGGVVPLSPLQQRFFAASSVDTTFSQSVLLVSRIPLSVAEITRAFNTLVDHHDVLRAEFVRDDNAYVQRIVPPGAVRIDVQEITVADVSAADWLRPHLDWLRSRLRLTAGALVQAAVVHRPDGDALLLAIHHLIVDGVSWRILIEDLCALLEPGSASRAIELSPRTDAVTAWAGRVASSDASFIAPFAVRVGEPASFISMALSSEETAAVVARASTSRSGGFEELLLDALGRALDHADSPVDLGMTIARESHGRDARIVADLDLSRTVGWLTSITPKSLTPGEPSPSPILAFNYLGTIDDASDGAVLAPDLQAARHTGALLSSQSFPASVECEISSGALRFDLVFDEAWFEHQPMVALAERFVAALREIAGREHSARSEMLHSLNVSLSEIEDICALSPLQEGLFFQHTHIVSTTDYIEQIVVSLEGDLDVDRVRHCWQQLAQDHAILRTAFVDTADGPLQVVLRNRALTFATTDCRHRDRTTPFDLSRDSLSRFSLFRSGERAWEFVWTYPHLILDGWSAALLFQEFLERYESAEAFRIQPASPRPTYADYVRGVAARSRQSAHEFWRALLSGYDQAATVTAWSIGAPAHAPAQRDRYEFGLTEEQSAQLHQLASQQSATMSAAALAVWASVLARMNNTRDVVFGSVVSVREPAFERTAGLFINTVPVRVTFDRASSIAAVIASVQQQTIAAQSMSWCPLHDIHSLTPLRQNLFDHIFIYENYPVDERLSAGTGSPRVTRASIEEEMHYGLAVIVSPGARLSFVFRFDTARYSHDDMRRLESYVRRSVDAMVSRPGAAFSSIDVVPVVERQMLVTLGRGADSPVMTAGSLLDLLDQTALADPGRIAVCCDDRTLTYRQLRDLSMEGARWLIAHEDVQPGHAIALTTVRSEALIVHMLAILRAGACFVPIDLSHPRERIDHILSSSAARQIALPSLDVLRASTPSTTPLPRVEPDSLAYVIHTSGSSGQPKGVMVTHANLSGFSRNIAGAFGLSASDCLLATTTVSFDISVLELLVAVAAGVCVEVAEQAIVDSPEALLQKLSASNVSVLQATPTRIAQLITLGGRDALSRLRVLLVGGEALPSDLARTLATSDRTIVHNVYGPTETTIWSTAAIVGRSFGIGRPLDAESIYVLSTDGLVAPAGTIGEICIGGAGVARGYLNQPRLTAERFLPDPAHAGARIYATGDLGRWNSDGTLECLGRTDHQVKIRGHRIELGEIETVLRRCAGVDDAVVIARTVGDSRELSLVAYVTGGGDLDPLAIRRVLAEQLPPAMVPAFIVRLDAMPTTPNQKIDRRALPDPIQPVRAWSAPRTPTEQLLAAVWCRVLSLQAVGTGDDFFSLGGHSLSAARLVATLRRDTEFDLSVADVFAHSTLSGLAARLDERAPAVATRDAIARVEPAIDYPLSHAQRRMWVLHQMDESRMAYNMPMALRLIGSLDVPRLSQAIARAIDRHESLRTMIVSVDGDLRQRVIASGDAPGLAVRAGLSDTKQFLTGEPLFVAELIPVVRPDGINEHVLSINMHHVISDGLSTGVLCREICRAYNGEPDLEPLRIQYNDVVAWQEQQLQTSAGVVARDYWRGIFSAPLPEHDLPVDRPRALVRSFRGRRHRFLVDHDLVAGLAKVCSLAGATPFMVVTAAVAILLARYSDTDDVVIGTPVSGRTHPDLANQIGLYVNTVALRVSVPRAATLTDVLGHVRSRVTTAFEHQHYPFDKLVSDIGAVRDTSRLPLFDVMVSFWDTAETTPSMTGLVVEEIDLPLEGSKADLTFNFTRADGRYSAAIDYNSDLFDQRRIARMSTHVVSLLRAFVDNREQEAAAVVLMAEAERRQIALFENSPAVAIEDRASADLATDPTADARTIVAAFETQATRSPHAIALECGSEAFTYAELNDRADVFAAELMSAYGVCAGDVVAIALEKNNDAIAVMLAILKCGAAYLPVDPDAPIERLRVMLDAAGARCVVASRTFDNLSQTLANTVVNVVALDALRRSAVLSLSRLDADGQHPRAFVHANSVAYVLFTSGSTGQPKGAAIDHRAVLGLVAALDGRAYKGLPGSLRVSLVASLVFDASVQQIFAALLNGHTLVIVPDVVKRDPTALRDFLVANAIQVLDCTPSLLSVLLETDLDRSPLLRVLVGGEVLTTDQAQRFYASHRDPRARLLNVYGLTECCVDSTMCEAPAPSGEASVPIGAPLGCADLHVLDDTLRAMPIGIAGEICIGGDGLAHGYVSQPRLTAERFVPSPFAVGGRLYRTGDRGRWRDDGTIEFIGRVDHQVKVRGHRIECGEVERALQRALPSVTKIAVEARPIAGGPLELVAFMESTTPLTSAHCRDALADVLPGYMIPSRFVVLARLPLLLSGKIDRRALPDPSGRELETGAEYQAPSTVTEQLLAEIWSAVLGRTRIGAHDSFFDLGGDSIKAIAVAARLHQRGLALNLRDVFLHPTIARLAAHVTQVAETDRAEQALITGDVLLTPIQRWFFDAMPSARRHFNQSVLLTAREKIDVDTLRSAMAALLQHHDALRSVFVVSDQRITQKIVAEMRVDVRVSASLDDHDSSFDLAEGPLIRAVVISSASGDRLLLEAHHLVIDGVSWRILLEDLSRVYAGQTLPQKTHSVQRWAAAIASPDVQARSESERPLWQAMTSAESGFGAWERPGSENGPWATATTSIACTAEESVALLSTAPRRLGVATDVVLLTALARTVAQWLGRPDTTIDLESHGREACDLDVSRTVGWFTSMFPVRLSASANETAAETMSRVKETLGQIPRNGSGYGILHSTRQTPGTDPPRRGLVFNYLGQFENGATANAFVPTDELAAAPHQPTARPSHDMSINAAAVDGNVRVSVTYVSARFSPAAITAFVAAFAGALREVTELCVSERVAIDRPRTDAGLSSDEIDEIVDGLNFQ